MTPSEFPRGTRVRVTIDRTGTVDGLIESPPGNPWGIHVRFDDEPRFSSEVNFNSGLTIEVLASATCNKTEGMTGLDCGREPGHPGRCFVGISYDGGEPYGWEARQAPEPAAVLPVEDNQ